MLEKDLEKKLKSYIEKQGGRCYKWVSPGTTGVPDRICILPGGRIVFVELKRPGRENGLSPRQKRVIGQLEDLGCRVMVINSEDDFYAI